MDCSTRLDSFSSVCHFLVDIKVNVGDFSSVHLHYINMGINWPWVGLQSKLYKPKSFCNICDNVVLMSRHKFKSGLV